MDQEINSGEKWGANLERPSVVRDYFFLKPFRGALCLVHTCK
jgi:hypothetical protein